jgi:hypothetical protein
MKQFLEHAVKKIEESYRVLEQKLCGCGKISGEGKSGRPRNTGRVPGAPEHRIGGTTRPYSINIPPGR